MDIGCGAGSVAVELQQRGIDIVGLDASPLAAKAAKIRGLKVHLIPTYQWICFHDVCPAVIGNIGVYTDEDHLTTSISTYLCVMLEKALTPLLGTRSS